MAHFAQLDGNNVVTQVIVIHNNELIDESGNHSEEKAIDFCKSLYGQDTIWVQTSYNTRGNVHYGTDGLPDNGTAFRGNYAGIGHIYDTANDVFYEPSPFPSWLLNHSTWIWEAPVPRPQDGKFYTWDEETISWKEYVSTET